jgi:DNA-binding NtrC family response regulator
LSAPLLVVEDRRSLGEMLAETLRTEGYEVELVLRGDTAVQRLQEGGPYLAVLTDLKLPGMDGLAVLRTARTVDPLLPVFLITGYATVETAVTALKQGARD